MGLPGTPNHVLGSHGASQVPVGNVTNPVARGSNIPDWEGVSTPRYMTNVFTNQPKLLSQRYSRNCLGSGVNVLVSRDDTRGVFEFPHTQSSLIDKDDFLRFLIQFNSIQFN